LATQNHAVALSLLPLSSCDGEEHQQEEAKLVDWDKNSLTEQQREKKITRVLLIKRIYRMPCSHQLMLSWLPSSKCPFF